MSRLTLFKKLLTYRKNKNPDRTHAQDKAYSPLSVLARSPDMFPLRRFLFLLPIIALGCQSANSSHHSLNQPPIALPSGCLDQAVKTGDHRRIALIVGVGEYRNEKVKDLTGPPNDADNIYRLLTRETNKGGYGFPKENVCRLVDSQATTDNFKKAFKNGLIDRVDSEKDVAFFFYAGHGSQVRDCNGDEPDEWDETFMLHDARSNGQKDLLDDEFNGLLAQLHKKTRNITVILDSCNSGTATRGDSEYVARYQPPDKLLTCPVGTGQTGDGGKEWSPEEFPGVVIFTAASDGTSALERKGRGIFTDALITALGPVGKTPITYAQLGRRIPKLVSAKSAQIPYFHGDLDKPVFGNTDRTRPLGWDVTGLTGEKDQLEIQLSGPPLPGIGPRAVLNIYHGAVTGADTNDPAKIKATVVLDENTETNATDAMAKIYTLPKDAPKIEIGDLAVLTQVSDEALKIKVRLRPWHEPSGLSKKDIKGLEKAIEENKETKMLVTLTRGDEGFEIRRNIDGELVLYGPENTVRKTFEDKHAYKGTYERVSENLWQHARQLALLQLNGETGSDFEDDKTLQAQLVPGPNKYNRCSKGKWIQAEPNKEQVIPLCHTWRLKVTLTEESPVPLRIGALILSTDGHISAIPKDNTVVRLNPGESKLFGRQIFRGTLPLDIQDRILVFGTQEGNPVKWHLLADTADTRGSPASGLYRVLDRYLRAGIRGQDEVAMVDDPTSWTMSTVTMRVEANTRFLMPDSPDWKTEEDREREYTIANFDIRPYLPDDHESALHKVLQKADALSRYAATDGVPYKQHSWRKSSDTENLKLGIDCSRSIWFAFTRAGLTYNQGDEYLYTGRMANPSSKMNEEFESCSNDPNLRIGDVLVYRDKKRKSGHTVMVIDPKKRIAWGSHGWDGNVRKCTKAESDAGRCIRESDTGVEYQLIKYKKDWGRWDRNSMGKVACWRHRQFIEQAETRGQPGVKALKTACGC
uniref:Caspase domain-containing protein n=1 Tax=Candidatus Kentrum sp. TUN TaxID=2126343 RepID=A0A450ZXI1_9GAMM|nr:MAG: Caspase domain-containing protein [Candidatus Kentron sp. TUN]